MQVPVERLLTLPFAFDCLWLERRVWTELFVVFKGPCQNYFQLQQSSWHDKLHNSNPRNKSTAVGVAANAHLYVWQYVQACENGWKRCLLTQYSVNLRNANSSSCCWLFLAFEDLGRISDNWFPACAFCCCCCCCCCLFEVEISSRILIPIFMPGSVYNGSASWDNCDRVFPDELRISSFPDWTQSTN